MGPGFESQPVHQALLLKCFFKYNNLQNKKKYLQEYLE